MWVIVLTCLWNQKWIYKGCRELPEKVGNYVLRGLWPQGAIVFWSHIPATLCVSLFCILNNHLNEDLHYTKASKERISTFDNYLNS